MSRSNSVGFVGSLVAVVIHLLLTRQFADRCSLRRLNPVAGLTMVRVIVFYWLFGCFFLSRSLLGDTDDNVVGCQEQMRVVLDLFSAVRILNLGARNTKESLSTGFGFLNCYSDSESRIPIPSREIPLCDTRCDRVWSLAESGFPR
jgi:hypothetical protein